MKTKQEKFTYQEFLRLYGNDQTCLKKLFQLRYGSKETCEACSKPFKYYLANKTKYYECAWCAHKLSPTANTIFHKSSTSLKTWFLAIFLFSHSKNGVSAKELQRLTGVTYKTAWRICHHIRKLFDENKTTLKGIVEVDETYMGGAEVKTDTYKSYQSLNKLGYQHETVNHGAGKFKEGNAHTNTIEGFWSQLKRSIRGTYHQVSPKYLQTYVDEFAYRYNHRQDYSALFGQLLVRGSQPD